MDVKIDDPKYPGLRVSYLYSSIFFAPNIYCDPNAYFYDDDLASKTVESHKYVQNRKTKNNLNIILFFKAT
jgi:voltage-dependent calcium channel alpha-2/delta-3